MAYLLKAVRLAVIAAAVAAASCSSSLPAGGGTGGTAQTGGTGGQGTGGSVDAGGDGVCHDLFYGGVPAPCCPDPPPDCTGEPDGYPGNQCVDRNNQFCSCACWSGRWQCGC